jgi:CRISPR-associated protein Cas5d
MEAVFEGPFGMFTAPGLRVERFSAPHPGASQARGMIEAIYWHPNLLTVIDEIALLSWPQYHVMAYNEVGRLPSRSHPYVNLDESRAQSVRTLLINPAFLLRFRYLVVDDVHPDKPRGMFLRRLEKGQHYSRKAPAMGRVRYPAYFRPPNEDDVPIGESADFGRAVLDIDYVTNRVHTFHSVMTRGRIAVPHLEYVRSLIPRVRRRLEGRVREVTP